MHNFHTFGARGTLSWPYRLLRHFFVIKKIRQQAKSSSKKTRPSRRPVNHNMLRGVAANTHAALCNACRKRCSSLTVRLERIVGKLPCAVRVRDEESQFVCRIVGERRKRHRWLVRRLVEERRCLKFIQSSSILQQTRACDNLQNRFRPSHSVARPRSYSLRSPCR